MTDPHFQISTVFFVQQESSGTLRFHDEEAYKVVKETWQGAQLLGSEIYGSFNTEEEAYKRCAELEAEE